MIAVAAAVTIVLLTAVAASRSNASGSSPRTLEFHVAFHDVEVDLGEQGPSLGDERTFADSLLDANGREVGHDAGVCIFTSLTPPEAACHITFLLPGVRSRRSSSTPRHPARSRRSSAAPAPIDVRAGKP
jgi:hypothetical protein